MGVTYSQFFPPSASLTELNMPSQQGKVAIITGGYSGIGLELASILYGAGAKVYIAGRSKTKADAALSTIKARHPKSSGELKFLKLHLDDLTTIKPAVQRFTAQESRLHTLYNNAGVSNPPKGSRSVQGHELQMATNCLGPYLLTQLLLPTLLETAKTVEEATCRVVWTASITVDFMPDKDIPFSEFQKVEDNSPNTNYNLSKVGNWFLANSLATQVGSEGILSVVQNPGNLKSDLTRHFSRLVPLLAGPLLHEPKKGAYTELWAGISPELKMKDGGKYIIPWGRLHSKPQPAVLRAMQSEASGEKSVGEQFVDWCNEQTLAFR